MNPNFKTIWTNFIWAGDVQPCQCGPSCRCGDNCNCGSAGRCGSNCSCG